jgi:hypothetical protein
MILQFYFYTARVVKKYIQKRLVLPARRRLADAEHEYVGPMNSFPCFDMLKSKWAFAHINSLF